MNIERNDLGGYGLFRTFSFPPEHTTFPGCVIGFRFFSAVLPRFKASLHAPLAMLFHGLSGGLSGASAAKFA